MNKVVLNKLVARGCDVLNETDYAILIDMISRIERGENFTSQELAENNFVSPASVSRLCKKLGFGFRELRQHIADELRSFHRPVRTPCDAVPGLALKHMLSEGIDRMLGAAARDLPRAIDALHAAERISVLGTGTSHIIAQYFAEKLQVIGKQAHAVRNDWPAGVFVNEIGYSDLVVIVSRSGESSPVISKASVVRRLNRPILAIGCEEESRLGTMSSLCLSIPGNRRSFDASRRITAYSLCAFFLIDLIVDEMISKA